MKGQPEKKEEEAFREENKIGHVLAGTRGVRVGDHRLRRKQTRIDRQHSRTCGKRAGGKIR
jgi:hypothetical protein